jgi:hypothetical protein
VALNIEFRVRSPMLLEVRPGVIMTGQDHGLIVQLHQSIVTVVHLIRGC